MRYSWIVGENDNYDCYVIIGDNRLTDRLFLIKLERLYFPVSDTPARNTCGSRFVVGSLGIFLSLSLSPSSPFIENLQFFKKYSLLLFFFHIYDSFRFSNSSNLGRGLDCLRFVWKKKRERGNCGYRKRIKVKIKLVESFLKFGSCKTFLWFIIGFNTKKNWSFFFSMYSV